MAQHPAAPEVSRQSRPRGTVRGSRRLPIEAIGVGLGLLVLLVVFVAADPPSHVTFSSSPFTDEAFNNVNARNFVQLGRWSTDEWNLYLVNLPFSLIEALWFQLVGVGIVQARLVTIACVSLAAAALVWSLRGAVGRGAALFAGLAFATSGLVLFYGRLAFLEDMVVLGLMLGTAVLARDDRLTLRWGVLSGVCYALAIGAKPSAGFAVAGILVAVALGIGQHDPAARRWTAGALAAIALAGLVWAAVIWLPNRDAVALDLRIWAPENLNLAPFDMLRSAWHYVSGDNDHLYGRLLGPVLLLGGAGLASVAIFRNRLSRCQTRLAVVAIGWLALGFGILLIASYRPNRYVLPLVPPLAILSGLGFHAVGQWLGERRIGGRPSIGRSASAVLVIALTAGAAVPGLALYGSWAREATYNLPDIQARFTNAVPDGARVGGRESALYLMRSHAITLITQPGGGPANHGDLYAQGVRWYVLPADDAPPPGVSDALWAARQRVLCADYGDVTECLFHVP